MSVTFTSGERGVSFHCSNGTAMLMLECLGWEYKTPGYFAVEELPKVRSALLMAINLAEARRGMIAFPFDSGPKTGKCRIIFAGRDDDQNSQDLAYLQGIVVAAQTAGECVYWG